MASGGPKIQDDPPEVIALILLLLVVIPIIVFIKYALFPTLFEELLLFYYRIFPSRKAVRTRSILNKHFPYYKELHRDLKNKFDRRLWVFIKYTKFITRHTSPIDFTTKTLIAANAIQLTLGLRKFTLKSYSRVIVYPKSYFSKLRNQWHKGEVNHRTKTIMISWDNHIKGNLDPDDGINLGLHEFMHAYASELLDENIDFDFHESYGFWKDIALIHLLNVKKGSKSILRIKPNGNLDEMLSICVEHFFEKPEEFDSHMPELFQAMKDLLRQDPKDRSNPIII